MQKFYSRFKRGDVWFLQLPTEKGDGTNSSVQKKSRPYVIVSCEENNNCAPTINVVPITTRDSDHLPPHVYFRYDIGGTEARNQLILCEQITTVSVDVFNNTRSYFMYSLSLELMNKVDEALAGQLGLRVRVADMNILENLVNKIVEQKETDLRKLREEALSISVNDLAAQLANKFGIQLAGEDLLNGLTYNNADLEYAPKELTAQLAATAAERTKKPEPAGVLKTTSTPTDEDVPASKTNQKKNQKNKWDKATMQMFVNDYATMSLSGVSVKYNLTKKSIQQMAWKFKKTLKEMK